MPEETRNSSLRDQTLHGLVLATPTRLSVLCLLAAGVLLFSLTMVPVSASSDEQVYYGHVPSRIWRLASLAGRTWINPTTIMDRADLVLIAASESTTATVYRLPENERIGSFNLNKFQRADLSLPNGSVFKVVANMPLTVYLHGGSWVDGRDQPIGTSTFYTSTNGGYIGKEFIFLALQPTGPGESVGRGGDLVHRIYALEDSHVTICDENSTVVEEVAIKANRAEARLLTNFNVYRLVSTGNIMLETFIIDVARARTVFYPAVEGGFVGRLFYGSGVGEYMTHGSATERAFVVTSVDDAKVRVIDLDSQREFETHTVSAGGNLSVFFRLPHMAVQSDKPIVLMFQSSTGDSGLAFGGLRAGQEAYYQVPEGESCIFTYKETTVTIDAMNFRVPADSIIPLNKGMHRISANENIIIQIVNIGGEQGFGTFGASVPSAQSLSITYADLRLKPIGEETTWIYYAAAVIPVVAIILVWRTRKRRKP